MAKDTQTTPEQPEVMVGERRTTPEQRKVIPGDRKTLFSAIKQAPDWVPQVLPHMFFNAEHHEGDGGQGTVTTYHLHEDHTQGFGENLEMKTTLEVFDEENCHYIADMQGDPRFKDLKFYVWFLPGPSPVTTELKWFTNYAVNKDNTPPPDNLLNTIPVLFENLWAYMESQNS